MTNRTKTGSSMNPAIRNRLVELLTDPDYDGMTQVALAAEAGIGERTLRNYLTPELWEEVRQLRLQIMFRSLALVDRAIFYKATQGDIHAAKLIYTRWDDIKSILPTGANLHSLGALDEAITHIEQRIDDLEYSDISQTTKTATAAKKTSDASTEHSTPVQT